MRTRYPRNQILSSAYGGRRKCGRKSSPFWIGKRGRRIQWWYVSDPPKQQIVGSRTKESGPQKSKTPFAKTQNDWPETSRADVLSGTCFVLEKSLRVTAVVIDAVGISKQPNFHYPPTHEVRKTDEKVWILD